jgi:protein-tyrosine-phosphatase
VNVLIVCTGNVSRSFLAENLLRAELARRKATGVSVSSAGLSALNGSPADPRMVEFLSAMRIAAAPHRSRRMNREDADWADLILAMEKGHAKSIAHLYPEAGGKVELLGKHIPGEKGALEIEDPFGGTRHEYSVAQFRIFLAVQNLARKLASEVAGC